MRIKKNIKLAKYTTFKIGGPAKYFCVVRNMKDFKQAQQFAREKELKSYVLGGGSNVLFSDDGFDGLVMKIENEVLEITNKGEQKAKLKCGAGLPLSKLVSFAIKKGLTGLEWAVGIPGSVGGAIRGNAGAFGSEMKDCLVSANAINTSDKEHPIFECRQGSCDFDYRNSVFKKNPDLVIWECVIELEEGDKKKSREKILEYAKKRSEKQPLLADFPSAGSIFKNPQVNDELIKAFERDKGVDCRATKVPAGWLIECCDLKEKKVGGAMISKKQANFIVNSGKARAEDVVILISLIKMKVRNEFGVQLEEEVQIIV